GDSAIVQGSFCESSVARSGPYCELLTVNSVSVSLIVLEPAFWDNYQIIYSSKLLNGTEALWIVGHMMRKFSC
ncbi:hypothetical protein N340_00961, partial [Tauraco erythrolophus]